jgi:hypothetical protein
MFFLTPATLTAVLLMQATLYETPNQARMPDAYLTVVVNDTDAARRRP